MKNFTSATVLAAIFRGVFAQSAVSTITAASYTTEVYEECFEETSTVTGTITQTYCHECDLMGSTTTKPHGAMVTTVWTTVFSEFCPTGLQPYTVTITESCTGTPTWAPSSSGYVPQGFTTTYVACHVCGPTPISTVLTVPIGSTPVPMPPASATPPPAATGSPSASVSVTPVATPAATPEVTPAATPDMPTTTPMATPPSSAPADSASTVPRVGIDVPAPSVSDSASTLTPAVSTTPLWSNNTMPAPSTTSSTIVPYTGAGSTISAGSWMASLVVGVLAALRLL